jgi:hypothetical protein
MTAAEKIAAELFSPIAHHFDEGQRKMILPLLAVAFCDGQLSEKRARLAEIDVEIAKAKEAVHAQPL